MLRTCDELDEERISSEATAIREILGRPAPDFRRTAERARDALGMPNWVAFLRRHFDLAHAAIDDASLELPRALWRVASNVIITTNYDLALRWSCPSPQDLREWALDEPYGFMDLIQDGFPEHPVVWHLHGTIHRPRDIVLTLSTYERLYGAGNAVDGQPKWEAARRTLQQLAARRTLLFIGFSLADGYFTTQLKDLAEVYDGAGRTHFALVRAAELEEVQQRIADIGPNVTVRCIAYGDHGQPLIDQLNALAALRGTGAPSGPLGGAAPPAPVVTPASLPNSNAIGIEGDALLLLRSWTPTRPADKVVVSQIGASPLALERYCVEHVRTGGVRLEQSKYQRENAYAWSTGADVWRQRLGAVPGSMLAEFARAAEVVLREIDPALGLPPERRYLAGSVDAVPQHSRALREGVATTVALLAHSDEQLRTSHGAAAGSSLSRGVVDAVLTPDWQVWASLGNLLPFLAEAAPETFLACCERSLGAGPAGISALPSKDDQGAIQLGLMAALETISWLPAQVSRVSLILGRLAAADDARQTEGPGRSLRHLLSFHVAPDANALNQRLEILSMLLARVPDVAWRLGVELLVARPSRRDSRQPLIAPWPTATGAPAPDPKAVLRASEQLADLLIAKAGTEEAWVGLLERAWEMPASVRPRIASAVGGINLGSGVAVWTALRVAINRGRRLRKVSTSDHDFVQQLRVAYARLTPQEPVARVAWLFEIGHVLPDNIESEWDIEEAHLKQLRSEAVRSIWEQPDPWGVLARLARTVSIEWPLGTTLAQGDFAPAVEAELLRSLDLEALLPSFSAARYQMLGLPWLLGVAEQLVASERVETAAAVLAEAQPSSDLWDAVEQLGAVVVERFWRQASRFAALDAADAVRVIENLLRVHRPRAALQVGARCAALSWQAALQLLDGLAHANEVDAHALAHDPMASYEIATVFAVVDPAVPEQDEQVLQQVLRLEVTFLRFLSNEPRGLKWLEANLSRTPEVFVGLVDGLLGHAGKTSDLDRGAYVVATRIIDAWRGYPGSLLSAEKREAFVALWAKEVIRLSGMAGHNRHAVLELVGKVLARVPAGLDGVWPCAAARECLVGDSEQAFATGLFVGKRNLRGVVTRRIAEGGSQERALATGYSSDAERVRASWPETAAFLDRLAGSYLDEASREDAEAETDRRRYGIEGSDDASRHKDASTEGPHFRGHS